MKILVVGGAGFLGRHLLPSLLARGHEVHATARSVVDKPQKDVHWHRVDMNSLDKEACRKALEGVDTLINVAGILRSTRSSRLQAVHVDGPAKLYKWAAGAGVKRVVLVSALGSRAQAASAYHRSKYAGEQVLKAAGMDWVILRPSLVYGTDGASTKQFKSLARWPWVPVFRGGQQRVQPVHVNELVELFDFLVREQGIKEQNIDVVGPRALNMREYYGLIRKQMDKKARYWNVPESIIRVAARAGDWLDNSPLCRDTLIMMGEHNQADPSLFETMLGRSAMDPEEFFEG